MTKINLAFEVSPAATARVEALLAEAAERDVNWNGANFNIKRDDFTCIPGNDSADAVSLMIKIDRAIAGDE